MNQSEAVDTLILMTGKKGYHLLSFLVPLLYHALANGLMTSMQLSKADYIIGVTFSISYIVAAVVAVIAVLYWQKKKALDVFVK